MTADFYAAQLQARQIQEDTGMTLDQILKLDMTEYARLTNRPTPTEAALEALGYDEPVPGRPRQEQAPAPVQEPPQPPQGIDVSSLSMSDYAQLRSQLGMGGREYGVGIMNSGQGTSDWIAVAQRKAGRSAMQGQNVQEAARPDAGKYLGANEPVQGRALFYRGQ
jgi:hypothetical protein